MRFSFLYTAPSLLFDDGAHFDTSYHHGSGRVCRQITSILIVLAGKITTIHALLPVLERGVVEVVYRRARVRAAQ